MKRTKTICTMGPNTSDRSVVMELARNDMDVARFNFSHGDYGGHQGRPELLKEAHKESDTPAATLLDTKGPKTRTRQLKGGRKMTLKEGQTYTLTTRELAGGDTVNYINYSGLNEDVAAGNQILIGDGLIELEVREMEDMDIVCEAINEGELGEEKGVNVPNVRVKPPTLTDRDKEDIRFGIGQGSDFIAASFMRTADYIRETKAMLDEQGSDMKIITEIENTEDIENLDAIIETADGTMVAGGDVGMKIPVEKVPYIQKRITHRCNEACKIVIIATQMLDSMTRNPRPTRTEVTDIANAVYDGTDAVMLSGETAMGKYPVDALKMMVLIALETRRHLDYAGYRQGKVTEQNMKNVSSVVCFASMSTAHDPDVNVIIAPGVTDFTTQVLSRWRPGAKVIGMSPSMATVRQIQLQWGVVPVWSRRVGSADELIENSMEELKDRGLVEGGGLAVVTVGVITYARHHEAAAQTNIMRVINIE